MLVAVTDGVAAIDLEALGLGVTLAAVLKLGLELEEGLGVKETDEPADTLGVTVAATLLEGVRLGDDEGEGVQLGVVIAPVPTAQAE
jgi:hypothetical protein